jgi:hypothetical protein
MPSTTPFATRLLWARESLRDQYERAGYIEAEDVVRAMYGADLAGDSDAFIELADEFGVE